MTDSAEAPEAPPPKRLELDPASVVSVYEELGKLEVHLDSDPLIYGPKRLNNKVAEGRAMLGRCETLFLQVSQDRHRFSRAHRLESVALDLAKKRLYDKDPEVRAGRSVSDRDAIATGKLSTQVLEANRLELAVQDLDALIVVIKAKRADLRDAEGRLRDQIRLCSEEIGLGGRWGSQMPGAPELEPGQGRSTGDDIRAVNDLLVGLGGETHLPALPDEEDIEEEDDSPPPPLIPEQSPSLGRVFEGMKTLPTEEVNPLTAEAPPDPADALFTAPAVEDDPKAGAPEEGLSFETPAGGGSFPSVESLTGQPEAADDFLANVESGTDSDGKLRIGPIPDDVLDNILDAFS